MDRLFLGITRPPMIAGVTHSYCAINGMATSLLFLASGQLSYFLMAIPIHAFGFVLCAKDPNQIGILIAHLRIRLRCKNAYFWRATSYAELD